MINMIKQTHIFNDWEDDHMDRLKNSINLLEIQGFQFKETIMDDNLSFLYEKGNEQHLLSIVYEK
ncbi:hypothetical protein KLEB273_gp236 [Bacillus phage vB_BauM_KLEB27-3]|nr:hypothetical protein KLEB273_gp236 [Bacillus phage vB_BauM_KLEB27-3]